MPTYVSLFNWTECYENSFIAEAIAWSDNGNHATIYSMGTTSEEAYAKLVGALRTQATARSIHKRWGR